MSRRVCSRSIRLAAPAAVVLAAGLAAPAAAVDKSWTCNTGDWSTPSCWSPIGVPGPADVARIGNLAGVQNNTVRLDEDDSVAGLVISDGMTFRTNGYNFHVFGNTLVSGSNTVNTRVGPVEFPSTLRVMQAGLAPDFFTHNLSAASGGMVEMSGGYLRATEVVTIGAATAARGHGTIELSGPGTTLVNHGSLSAVGGHLRVTQSGNGLFDLDGATGSGALNLASPGGVQLSIEGQGLSDAFSGSIALAPAARLHVVLASGWTADGPSTIQLVGTAGGAAARITGSAFRFQGQAQVSGPDGRLRFESATTFENSLLLIDAGNLAEVTGAAIIDGGAFVLAQGARLDFDSATEVRGGSFETFSNLLGQGVVSFDGPTQWRGTVEIDGIARQNGAASVTAATTINAGVFDMDGTMSPAWTIQNGLTLNTGAVEFGGNSVNSPLSITGGTGARLTVNLDGPGETWMAAGSVTLGALAGAAHLPVVRVAGSPVIFTGAINVASGRPRVMAPATLAATATVGITAVGAELRLDAASTIRAGATFQGAGALVSGPSGVMTLENGVATGTVGLINTGVLHVGAQAGAASVNRFENAATGTWRVSLGGTNQGSQHDHLIVAGGTATLGGRIEVDLIDIGGGVFAPQVGQQFTVLTALAGVVGSFDNNPVTVAGSRTYQWSVQYLPNSVVLHLDSINGCYPDCDTSTGPGVLDIFDFLCFQNLFDVGDPYACDADTSTGAGVCDIFDFLAFQNAFSAGCP